MAVVDNLGREISQGIDQSAFIKQMADSLRSQDLTFTKTSEHAEEIASGSGKLPQEIADKVYEAFKDELTKSVSYLETIKKFCENKSKENNDDKKGGNKGIIDAITVLGNKLAARMSTPTSSNTNDFASGITAANVHLAAIAGSTSSTAQACSAMAAAFLHRGSGYTHDIHCEAILAAMQKDIRNIGYSMSNGSPVVFDDSIGNIVEDSFIHAVKALGAPKIPGTPSPETPSPNANPSSMADFDDPSIALANADELEKNILHKSGQWNDQMSELESRAGRLSNMLGVDKTTISRILKLTRDNGLLTAEQLQTLNLMVVKSNKLGDSEKLNLELAGRDLLVHNDVKQTWDDILGIANKQIDRLGKLKDIQGQLTEDTKVYAKEFIKATTAGLSGGLKTSQLFEGIWGGQVEQNKNLHEALYVTQGLNAGLDAQRQQYMKLGREASAVAETGANILDYQKAYLANMKSGIKDAQTLSRVTRAGVSAAAATGMDVAQTAQMFGQWNIQLGLSSNQLSQVGRAVKFAAQATGLMGSELAGALQSAKEFVNEMRNAATLTSDAAGAFVQFSASAKKFGVEKSLNPLLKAMSSTVEFYEHASDQTRSLLVQAASTVNRSGDLHAGTIMNSESGRKDMGKGLENILNSFLGKFGKDISQIDKLNSQEKMRLNLELQFAYGMQLGEFQKTIEAYKEGTKSVTDKINDINKQLSGNLTQQERQALLDQKRGMELQQLLGGLTKLDEAAKSAKTMTDALKSQNMTQDQLRKQLTDTVSNVNDALVKSGKKNDIIDPSKIEAALRDPTQYRELLSGINAAEQKAQVAAKAAADPVLGAQQKMNELQAKVVENTGKIAEELTSFLGPRGVIAAMLLNGFLNSNTGNTLINKTLTGIQASLTSRGSKFSSDVTKNINPKTNSETDALVKHIPHPELEPIVKHRPHPELEPLIKHRPHPETSAFAKNAAGVVAKDVGLLGEQAAIAAPLMTRLTTGISSMSAMLLPFIKIIAIVGIAIAAFMALFQGLQKAFDNIGFDMSELTAIGQKVWNIIKKIWNGLTNLLGVALIPLAHAIKFLAKGITWLLDKINSLLDSIGMGSDTKVATAESSGGAAAADEVDGGGGVLSTKKQQNAAVDAINTQPVKMIEKNLEEANANLPDNKKIISNIMSIFAWLGGFSIAIGLFAVLATYFNLTTGQIIRVAIVSGLALAALLMGVALLTNALTWSFKTLSQSIDSFSSTWESLGMWKQMKNFFAVAYEMLAWTAIFTVGLAVWSIIGLQVGAAALIVGAAAGIVMLAFATFNLVMALMNAILTLSLKAMVGSMNWLVDIVNKSNIWGSLKDYLSAMYQMLVFVGALNAALAVWAVVGLQVGAAALVLGAFAGIVMLAFATFNLVMALMNAILALSIKAMVGSMNWLTDIINDFDIWGSLKDYISAMYQMLAFVGALNAALAVWAVVGLSVGSAALVLGAFAGTVMLSFAVFNLAMALMNAILILSLKAMVGSMNWLTSTINELGIWDALNNYISSMYLLLKFTTVMTGALGMWAIFGTFIAAAANTIGLMIGVVALSFSLFNIGMSLMNMMLTFSLKTVVSSMNEFSQTVNGLGIWEALANYIGAMSVLRDWTAVFVAAIAGWTVVGFVIAAAAVTLGWAAAQVVGAFALLFAGISWMAETLSNSVLQMNYGINKLIEGTNNLPKNEKIKTTMDTLFNWIFAMQSTINDLNVKSGLLKTYGLWWYWVTTTFTDRFNNAIRGISSAFTNIDQSAIGEIEERLRFIDEDLPDVEEVSSSMSTLREWIVGMQNTMSSLDLLSGTIKQYGTWWWSTVTKFTDRFNNAIRGISTAFNNLNFDSIQEIQNKMKMINDGIAAVNPMFVLYTMLLLKAWLYDMGNTLENMNKVFSGSFDVLNKQIAKGIKFRDQLNKILTGIKSVMDGLQTEMLQGLGAGFKSDFISKLPTRDEILKTYKDVEKYITEVSAIFPDLSKKAESLKTTVSPYLKDGGKFVAAFSEITNGIKVVMDQMSTEILKNLGNKFKGNVVDSLPSSDAIKKTYAKVSDYIKDVAGNFTEMAKNAVTLQQETNAQMSSGDTFVKVFSAIVGKVKSVMDQMSTELLNGLGKKWQNDIVSKLPPPNEIKNSWGDVKKYITDVAAIFPDMATEIKVVESSTTGALDSGKNFGTTLKNILTKMKEVFVNMNTGLLVGLGGQWQSNIIRKLPTADKIWATWNDPNPSKGVKSYLKSIAELFPYLEDEVEELDDEININSKFGETLTKIMERVTGVFRKINTTLLHNMGQFGNDVKQGFISKLPQTTQIENSLRELETWLKNTAQIIDKNLGPMVTRLESTLTPSITKTGNEAAESLGSMIDAVGGIFRRISVVSLKTAFAGFSKKTVDSLPKTDDLLNTFSALEDWMKSLVDKVLPKLMQMTNDLKGALESQLNKGVAISRDFGNMVQMIVDIFKNIKLNALSTAVRGFVRSWGRGLPPANDLKNIMEGLIKWMQDIFGTDGPMKIMEEAMTNGPLANISVIAEAIKEHAATMAEAIASITDTFKAIDPSKAIRAIEKLQRLGGKKMPNREEVVAAIERVQTFVSDASAALHRGAEGVTNTERALGNGQNSASSFISTSAINADPMMSNNNAAEISVTRPSQNQSTLQTQIGQRLASVEPPASVNAANQQLSEIAQNTRQMAENQRETNRILAAVLGTLSGTGNSSSGSTPSTASNIQPSSTPLFPELRRGFSQGAQKRRVNMN